MFMYKRFYCTITAPPEITVEKTWVHAAEGYEAQLVCIIHGDTNAEVNWIDSFFLSLFDYEIGYGDENGKIAKKAQVYMPCESGWKLEWQNSVWKIMFVLERWLCSTSSSANFWQEYLFCFYHIFSSELKNRIEL
jgi:hypothetical protein